MNNIPVARSDMGICNPQSTPCHIISGSLENPIWDRGEVYDVVSNVLLAGVRESEQLALLLHVH